MLCQFQVHNKVNQLYIYIYLLFWRFFSHIGHYRVLSRVPRAIWQVLISYLFYIQQCVYVNPNLPIYPSPPISVLLGFFLILYFPSCSCKSKNKISVLVLVHDLNRDAFPKHLGLDQDKSQRKKIRLLREKMKKGVYERHVLS